MKQSKCAKCDSLVSPRTFREPKLFVQGMQVGGRYYKACPECLCDIQTGEDRQELDVVKAMNRMAEAENKAAWYDLKETFMALLYVIAGIAGIIFLFWMYSMLHQRFDEFMFWFKGTKLYYDIYMNWLK